MPYAYCEQIGKEIRDISDEIPFDIPDSWEWVRLGYIIQIESGQGLTSKQMVEGNIPVYGGNGITGYHNESIVHKETIVIGRVGYYCGSVHITEKEAWVTDNAFITTYPEKSIFREYLVYTLRYMNLGKNNNATAQPVVSGKKIYPMLFPLPPLAEQHRIVSKIRELLPYIDKYGKAEEQLTALNTTFPEALKKSILQEAVQGKLVPQNLDDEPASVLLERIRAEKQVLIKAGKIKKDKHESVIVTRDKIPYEIIDGKERCIADEVPFELPDSWCWCRLSSFATKITDGTHHSPPNIEKGEYKYITAKNIKDAGVNLANITYVSKEIHEEIYSRCNPEYGDVLLIKDGATTGVVTVNNIEEPFSLLSSVALIKCPKDVNPWYLVYVLRSDLFYKNMRSQMKGTGITRITLKQIEPLLIPVPPLSEQHRIVSKIEEIMPFINTISK